MKLTTLAVLASFITFPSAADSTERWRGIFCDTQAQVERVVTLGTKLGGAAQGIMAVNAEVGGDTQACIYGVVVGIRGKAVSTILTPDGLLDVVPWHIKAVDTPFGLMALPEEQTWYTLVASEERPA